MREKDLRARLQPPGYVGASGDVHPLGTDQLGRDLLSRMIHGSRVSLTVGYVGVTIGGVFGTVLGILAGYRRAPQKGSNRRDTCRAFQSGASLD